MKHYQTPTMTFTMFYAQDVITASDNLLDWNGFVAGGFSND